MSGPSRPPAPQCAREGCTDDAKWSPRSGRHLKDRGDAHAAPATRGTCGKGRHPRPQPGERCQECKAEWQANRPSRAVTSATPTSRLSGPHLSSVRPTVTPRRQRHVATEAPAGAWPHERVEVFRRYPAKGGPGDPRWTEQPLP